jgi:plastocyanin
MPFGATTRIWTHASAAALMAGVLACGGGNGSPSGPSPISGAPGPSGATITITNGAVSPRTVQVSVGQSVTVVNNDNRGHEIASDPHPAHTLCPEMNALGSIPAGATRQTNAFPTARTCSFHDHNDPDNASLKGSIEIR